MSYTLVGHQPTLQLLQALSEVHLPCEVIPTAMPADRVKNTADSAVISREGARPQKVLDVAELAN